MSTDEECRKEFMCISQLVRSGVSAEMFNQLATKTRSNSIAVRLRHFWEVMIIHGEDYARREFNKSTFYRNKQLFEEFGISFNESHLSRAVALIESNDETVLRTYDQRRHVVECLGGRKSVEYGGSIWPENRKRKFSNPLFLTPNGFLNAFPENDEDLFSSLDSAQLALKKYVADEDGVWSISSTTLKQQLKTKQYLRWLKDVKPLKGEYKEPRKTLEEKAEIFRNSGLDGLKAMYTKSHAFHTMAQLEKVDLK